MTQYSSFAQFYDGLMQNAEYEKRCSYIIELMKRHKHNMGITLDLACGTGRLTRLLAQEGIDIYGIDASSEMLSEAMQKSSEQGLQILYLHQKMQQIDLYGTINTCICTLDSINHLTNIDDVQKTFDRVSLFMDKDGIFMFDVNTLYKHNTVLADNTFVYENEKVFCVWQNSILNNDTVKIDLDFFEENNGAYNRTSESFCERAYSDENILAMLNKAGFEIEAEYGDLTFDLPQKDEQRVIYVARMKTPKSKEI